MEPLRALIRAETGVRGVQNLAIVQVLCRPVRSSSEHVEEFRAVHTVTGG